MPKKSPGTVKPPAYVVRLLITSSNFDIAPSRICARVENVSDVRSLFSSTKKPLSYIREIWLRHNACTSTPMVSTIFVVLASVMTKPFLRMAVTTSLAADRDE